jgi:hypothetical protein
MPRLLAALLLLALATPAAASPPAADPLAPLKPLLGEWAGDPMAGPGQPTLALASFALDLDGKILVRRNHVEFPPGPGAKKGAVHEDLLVVWAEGNGLRASYFDNEGHVIQYRVTVEGPRLVFESAGAGPGPRFRLEYTPQGDAWMVAFSMAQPGGAFTPYQAGTMHRRGR